MTGPRRTACFRRGYLSTPTDVQVQERHMKEVKNGETGNELEGQGELEGETKLDDNSNQPKNKQLGIFILLQVRKRNLLRCCVLKITI